MRSAIGAVFAFSFISLVVFSTNDNIAGQEIRHDMTAPTEPADKPQDKHPVTEKNAVEEELEQKKADIATLKAANLPSDGKVLLRFFRQHSVTDPERARLKSLINQLGDDDFNKREAASAQIEEFGVAAIGLLRQAEQSTNPEILRRCERCLRNIEKLPTRALACAAARLIADMKPDDAIPVLLGYLPTADDESIGDEARAAIAALAMKDGKPDPVLLDALKSKEKVKRSAAMEAFARKGDQATRAAVRKMTATEPDAEIKLRVAVALVSAAKDKDAVEDMIKFMFEAPVDARSRPQELLLALAGDKAPMVSVSGEGASGEQARDAWLAWWKQNEKTVRLAILDEMEPMLGYTLIIGGDQVKEVTRDKRIRWEIKNLGFPLAAVVLPWNRVIIADDNHRVTERDTFTGKVIWSAEFITPLRLQPLPNGNLVVMGRGQVVEWDRNRKPITLISRQEFDIVDGKKLPNGNFAVYFQAGEIAIFDKSGKLIDKVVLGNGPTLQAIGTMQALPNGKFLVTQASGVAEVDFALKSSHSLLSNWNPGPTSAQLLPSGNILAASWKSHGVIVEIEPKSKRIVWEYKTENDAPRVEVLARSPNLYKATRR